MLLYMPRTVMERYLHFPKARGRGGLPSEIEGRNSTWRPDGDSKHALTKVGFRVLRPANRTPEGTQDGPIPTQARANSLQSKVQPCGGSVRASVDRRPGMIGRHRRHNRYTFEYARGCLDPDSGSSLLLRT